MSDARTTPDTLRTPGWTPGRLALWGGFFVTGVATVLLGPLIPELRPAWGIDSAQSAVLFPALFIATSIGSIVSSVRLRWSLLGGYLLMGLGFVVLPQVPWPYPALALVAVGLGVGLVNPATNLIVAFEAGRDEATASRRGAILARLNLIWGIGAVFCPLLFAAVRQSLRVDVALAALGVVAVGIALAIRSDRAIGGTGFHASAGPERADGSTSSLVLGVTALLPIAMVFFLYVGIETAVGGWLVELADQIGGVGVASMLIASGYWAALLLGRGLAPRILRHVSETALFVGGVVVALIGVTVLWTSDSRAGAALGGALAGFGLAPVFPLTVSLLAARAEAIGTRNTGWVFAFMGVGGAAVPWVMTRPWLVSRLPGAEESLARGFAVPWLALVLLLAIFALQRVQTARR